MNLKKRLAYIQNLDVVRHVQVLLGLLALGFFATTGVRADLATYFDESTMPTNLFLDVPNTSVGTITLQNDLSRLLFYGPGRDIWSSRNGVPFAWTPVPGVGIGGSWEAETEIEYGDTNVINRIAGMTLYSGPDGAGGSNYGQEFTFGLDHWDGPNGVWVQGLGDNRPGDSGNLNIPLTANKVTLRMVVSRGPQNYHTYNFYYRLTTNDTWSSVGTIHHTAAFSRVALFCKVNNTGSTIMMNVAFNHFMVTPLSLGQNYAYTTNAKTRSPSPNTQVRTVRWSSRIRLRGAQSAASATMRSIIAEV